MIPWLVKMNHKKMLWCTECLIFYLLGYALFQTVFAERRGCETKLIHSSKELLDFRSQCNISVLSEPLGGFIVLLDLAWYIGVPPIALSGNSTWNRRKRKQKQGYRSGVFTRLRSQAHRPPLPSFLFPNARSIAPKIDELHLQIATCRGILFNNINWNLASSFCTRYYNANYRGGHFIGDSKVEEKFSSPDLEFMLVRFILLAKRVYCGDYYCSIHSTICRYCNGSGAAVFWQKKRWQLLSTAFLSYAEATGVLNIQWIATDESSSVTGVPH